MENSRERYGRMDHGKSYESLKKFVRDSKYIHYVGMVKPPHPGVMLCSVKLEYTYFIPGTPSNDEFLLKAFKWEEIIWIMISIPKEKSHLMEKVATECGLRIVNRIPTLIGGGAADSFPANNDNVFTLENTPGRPTYSNDPTKLKQILGEEKAKIEAIENEWRSRN
ncbi:MAG: hypothetical protein NT136_02275 [Candidatus Moranbacteria bacterium]|nr:hypothetical protein [Candidatus Moranbacteria bacterium]